MKKIISLILVLIMICTALASCSDDGVPDGMKSVTVAGDPFILYVPESFTSNTSSGVSGAYYNHNKTLDNTLIVTARYYTPSADMTLDEYMNKCAESYAAHLEGFEKSAEIAADMLSEKKALRLEYKMTKDEKVYTVVQRSVKWNGDFVSLNFYATGTALETYSEWVTKINDNFTLVEKGERGNVIVTDDKTPEGMRIASPELVEYCFYVPNEWTCDPNLELTVAYHPETRANVTVTAYSPSDVITADKYVEDCAAEYKETINGFEELERGEYKGEIDGNKAASLIFGAEYDGVSYKVYQVSFVSKRSNLCYSITYTATESDFDTHLADFEKMLEVFDLR